MSMEISQGDGTDSPKCQESTGEDLADENLIDHSFDRSGGMHNLNGSRMFNNPDKFRKELANRPAQEKVHQFVREETAKGKAVDILVGFTETTDVALVDLQPILNKHALTINSRIGDSIVLIKGADQASVMDLAASSHVYTIDPNRRFRLSPKPPRFGS